MMLCRKSTLRSFLINQELLEDHELRRREIRLLLLGSRGSGRSTMVKQLRIHYGDSFPSPVRKTLIPFIIANLADAVVCVIKLMQESTNSITDLYIKELAMQLVRNQPPEGYATAVSFTFYNKSLATGTTTKNPLVDLKEFQSIIMDEKSPQDSARMSGQSNTSGPSNLHPKVSPTHSPHISPHIKLSQCLGVREIQSLLGSIHPEVDWAEVIQNDVFNKVSASDNPKEVLAAWLENAFKTGRLHPAKVMAALQERVCNPHIRKLPAEIAALLPPPNKSPPTPPSTSAPDLDSNMLTDTDDWSSDTSFRADENSMCEAEVSFQAEEPPEENQLFDEKDVTNAVTDEGDSLVQNFRQFNFVSLSGWMLKLIIDRPEFQSALSNEGKYHLELSTSKLYFINNVDRFIQNDYVPTLRDILLVQMPYNAVRESLLQIGPTLLRLVNVGDQRGDRRKWMDLFDTIHTVLFFASLVDFLEKSNHSEFETKLDESLAYFRFVVESLPLSRKDLILFLTKKDILPGLLSNESFAVPSNHPVLKQSRDSEMCIAAQIDLFLSKCKSKDPKAGRVFTHALCLLDIDEMKMKSRSVLKDVLEFNFRRHAMF